MSIANSAEDDRPSDADISGLSDALKRLLGGQSALPLTEQVARLERVRAAYEQASSLIAGEFVRFKDGLGIGDESRLASTAFMFWRDLDLSHPQDRLLAESWVKTADDRIDCLVAILRADRQGVDLIPTNRAYLEPWTPPTEGY